MAPFIPFPTNSRPIEAEAIDGEVVIKSAGDGLPFCVSITPQAVLASLERLREAAEEASNQVRTATVPNGDIVGRLSNSRVSLCS